MRFSSLTGPAAGEARSPLRGILRNAGLLLGGKGFSALLSLGYLALAARALGIEQFGVLVLIHGFAQTVGELVKFQSWQLVLHYGHALLGRSDSTGLLRLLRFSALLDIASGLLGSFAAVIAVAALGPLLGWSAAEQPAAMLYMTSVLFMVSATPTGVLRLLDHFGVLALRSGSGGLLRFLGALAGFALGLGLEAFLAIWYAATVWGFLLLTGSALLALKRRGLLHGRHALGKPLVPAEPGLWRFVWANNFNTALGLVQTRVGLLLVGALLGASEAALYRVAQQIADALAKPARMVVIALYPELVRLRASGDRAALGRVSWRLTLGCGLVATALFGVVALAGEPLLGWVLGDAFRGAGTVLTLLFAAAVIGVWALSLEPLLISLGRATSALEARFVVTLLFLPLLYTAILEAGLRGAGAAAVAGAAGLLAAQLLPLLQWFRSESRAGT